jgi:hypothetical protein
MRRLVGCVLAGAAAAAPLPGAAATIAVLQGLDKTTARVSTFEAPVDQTVAFGALRITVRACVKRPPEEPPETAAFLEIQEVRPGGGAAPETVFTGWMFKSSPALSALENPVYDVGVLDCKEASGSEGGAAGK